MMVPKFGVLEFLGAAASASVVPIALFDPAIAGFAAMGAVVLGGMLALRSLRYACLNIALAVLAALALCHYTAKGFFFPTATSLTECGLTLAPSLVVATIFMAVALYRSRRPAVSGR
jgi:hypothetical protein